MNPTRRPRVGIAGTSGCVAWSPLELIGSALRLDGWENVVLGLGGTKDPSAYTQYAARAPLTEDTLEALYVEDHFAAKIVEAIPAHALRPGWDLTVPGDPQKAADIRAAYATREEELELAAELAQGWAWGRCFGGALTWVGADDGREPMLALDEANITSVRWLHTFDRRDVQIWRYYDDPKHPKFRRPELYKIQPLVQSGAGGAASMIRPGGILVHESRCVAWGGQSTTDRRRQQLQGWDDSVLERCWDALKQLAENYAAQSMLLGRISQSVYKLKNLYSMIAGKQKEVLSRRMGMLEMSRSRARAILLDTDEDFLNVTQPIAGVPEAIQTSVLRVASCAEMPVTILMGQSPAGMDATGEGDMEVWSATVSSERELVLRQRHERVVRLLLLAKNGPTGGVEPDRWSITYRPLREPTRKELAEVSKLEAETDAVNIDKGVYPAEAAAFRYGPNGLARISLDETELSERLERRRELAKMPPKDNAELGTIAPRTAALLEVISKAAAGHISRESALAILVETHRYTEEAAERLLGPGSFVPTTDPPSGPTPGPESDPQSGQAAGAPQPAE